MDNEGKILGALGLVAVLVTLFVPWASGFTVVDLGLHSVFASVNLPLIVGCLLIPLRQLAPGLLERISVPAVDRLLVVFAVLAQIGATIAFRPGQGVVDWGPGFWLTWLLCLAAGAVVVLGGWIPLLAGAGAGGVAGQQVAPAAAFSAPSFAEPSPAMPSFAEPSPAMPSFAEPSPAMPSSTIPSFAAPAPAAGMDPIGYGGVEPRPEPVQWLAVPAGTMSSSGHAVPSDQWLAVVTSSASSVTVRAESGAVYEVPAHTSFVFP